MSSTSLTNEDYAYLAGLVDGDGCIALYMKKDKKASRGYTFSPMMVITAKNIWFLEGLAEKYGGKINYAVTKSAYKEGSKSCTVRWTANPIRELLPRMLPYLVLKRREAELLLEALSITEYHRKRLADNDNILYDIVMNIKSLKRERIAI